MNTVRTGTTLALLLAALSAANASEITISTGYSTAGQQATPQAYQSVVEAAVATATPGYGSTSVEVFDGISNHKTLSGASRDLAYKFEVDFFVTEDKAGTWSFRGGVDFGDGGVMMLDGVPLHFSSDDLWWAGSYGNSREYLAGSAQLASGAHTLVFYGLENCCDGANIGQQAQFRIGDGAFTTFSTVDGLTTPIPEPATVGMLLGGLGMLAAVGRWRTRRLEQSA
ncbi:CCXG family PEP-CTERM protein [Pseudoduganella sp. GCM10020061]|uniref:CCXG family PEP-CTERM protein n=1 Tax=Pseudoduganella sp. GCM10020061 TaxID=3317345 RepID=UPI00363489AE